MSKYKYMVVVTASSNYDITKSKTIARRCNDNPYERYDPATKDWMTDFELSRVFFGGLEFEMVAEEKAMELISKL